MHHQGINFRCLFCFIYPILKGTTDLDHFLCNICINLLMIERLIFFILVIFYPGCSIVSRGGVCGDGPRCIMDRVYHCGQGSCTRYSDNRSCCVIYSQYSQGLDWCDPLYMLKGIISDEALLIPKHMVTFPVWSFFQREQIQ